MAAYGTKKPGADEALQLTFPSEFSRAYRQEKMKLKYAQTAVSMAPAVQDYVGNDLQAQYHQEKRADAHRMVRAAVEATQQARARAFSSAHGVFGMPKAVLGQRKIGSDYGVGNGGNIGFVHGGAAGLTGGVLGSPEGMAYAKGLMQRRKAQLDAIAASALEGPTMQAQMSEPALDFSETARVELVTFLSQLASQIAASKLELGSDTFRRFVSLLIRFVTVCEKEELDDVHDRITTIFKGLEAADGGRYGREVAFIAPMAQMMEKVLFYINMMYKRFGSGTRPTMNAKESRDLSRAALKASGLTAFNSDLSKIFAGLSMPLEDTAGAAAPARPPGGPASAVMLGPGAARSSGIEEGRRQRQEELGLRVPRPGSVAAASAGRFSRAGVSAEESSGPVWASTAGWSETARDEFGRQGTAARGARRYAGEGEGDIIEHVQDLDAQAAEEGMAASAGGMPASSVFSRLQSPIEGLEGLTPEQTERMRMIQERAATVPGYGERLAAAVQPVPSEGDYWTAWQEKGYRLPSVASYVYQNVPKQENIAQFVDGFSGQGRAASAQMRTIINSLRTARGANPTSAEVPYSLRQMLRAELNGIFE